MAHHGPAFVLPVTPAGGPARVDGLEQCLPGRVIDETSEACGRRDPDEIAGGRQEAQRGEMAGEVDLGCIVGSPRGVERESRVVRPSHGPIVGLRFEGGVVQSEGLNHLASNDVWEGRITCGGDEVSGQGEPVRVLGRPQIAASSVDSENRGQVVWSSSLREVPEVAEYLESRGADLDGLSVGELTRLQWELERHYHSRILASSPGSERATIVADAYEDVATVMRRVRTIEGRSLAFGLQERDVGLVHRLLSRRPNASFFELGFGAGALIADVWAAGYAVSGVEAAPGLVALARERVGSESAPRLREGEFLSLDLSDESGAFDVVYWNDVLEHVHPDDAVTYVRRLRGLLRPGGVLVTITPNWYVRPFDITRRFRPPRSTAEGLHLKEYTLSEVVELMKAVGLDQVRMPLACTRRRTVMVGNGLLPLKKLAEPLLALPPIRLARVLAGGFGYYCVIASERGAR